MVGFVLLALFVIVLGGAIFYLIGKINTKDSYDTGRISGTRDNRESGWLV